MTELLEAPTQARSHVLQFVGELIDIATDEVMSGYVCSCGMYLKGHGAALMHIAEAP